MTEEKKAEQITFNVDQINNIVKAFMPYYPLVKMGARLMGVKIPPELDEFMRSIQSGEPPDLEKLQALGESMERKVGEPVLTRSLAEEAYYLHHTEQMGTRQIAEYLTNERDCPCSHATVARWINIIDAEKQASKVGKIYSILKYGGIAVLCVVCTILGSKFL